MPHQRLEGSALPGASYRISSTIKPRIEAPVILFALMSATNSSTVRRTHHLSIAQAKLRLDPTRHGAGLTRQASCPATPVEAYESISRPSVRRRTRKHEMGHRTPQASDALSPALALYWVIAFARVCWVSRRLSPVVPCEESAEQSLRPALSSKRLVEMRRQPCLLRRR